MKYIYNNIDITNILNYETLLKWNKEYPPVDHELNRNLLIEYYQGNKNIFIDNHDFIELFINKLLK